MPWIFNEDQAVKAKLQGLRVTDTNSLDTGGRPVTVRFRLPETELGDLVFPCIVIEHAQIDRDQEREHRGYIQLPYAPEGLPLWEDPNISSGSLDPRLSPYKAEFPIPYNIDYYIRVLSRKYQHQLMLVGALAQQDRIPARFGALDIPQDGTVRRVDVIGGPELSADKDADGERLFTATYRIRVSTELVATQVNQFYRVLELVGSVLDKDTGREMATWWNTYDGQPPTP